MKRLQWIMLCTAILVGCNKQQPAPEPQPEPEYDEYAIQTPAQLADFLEIVADTCKAGETYYLTQDMDMSEYPTAVCASSFNGTLDGRGYTVSNLSAQSPLFNTIAATGSLKNITLDGSCSFIIPTAMYATFGCICSKLEGTLSGVTSAASLTESGDDTVLMGGFVGEIVSGAHIKNCIQEGSVIYSGTGASSIVSAFIGSTPVTGGSFDLSGCKINSDLSAANVSWTRCGMVVGRFPNQNQDCTLGTETSPVLIAGSIKTSDRDTKITCRNHQSYLSGYDNLDACGNFVYGDFDGEKIDATGKVLIMVGNSQTYWGGCVKRSSDDTTGLGEKDENMIFQFFKTAGQPITVYDLCHPGASIQSYYKVHNFDSGGDRDYSAYTDKAINDCGGNYHYVFFQECGHNWDNTGTIKEIKQQKFTNNDAVFFYVAHNHHFANNAAIIINNIYNRVYTDQMGLGVCEWGRLAADLDCGNTNTVTGKTWLKGGYVNEKKLKVHGATQPFHFHQFTKCNLYTITKSQGTDDTDAAGILKGMYQDHHHSSPLGSYIQCLMMFSSVTGQSCVGQPCKELPWDTLYFGDGSIKGIDSFIRTEYLNKHNVTQNIKEIIASDSDVDGLQRLCNYYMAPYRIQ